MRLSNEQKSIAGILRLSRAEAEHVAGFGSGAPQAVSRLDLAREHAAVALSDSIVVYRREALDEGGSETDVTAEIRRRLAALGFSPEAIAQFLSALSSGDEDDDDDDDGGAGDDDDAVGPGEPSLARLHGTGRALLSRASLMLPLFATLSGLAFAAQ